jgi:hypothetical protein
MSFLGFTKVSALATTGVFGGTWRVGGAMGARAGSIRGKAARSLLHKLNLAVPHSTCSRWRGGICGAVDPGSEGHPPQDPVASRPAWVRTAGLLFMGWHWHCGSASLTNISNAPLPPPTPTPPHPLSRAERCSQTGLGPFWGPSMLSHVWRCWQLHRRWTGSCGLNPVYGIAWRWGWEIWQSDGREHTMHMLGHTGFSIKLPVRHANDA